MLNCKVGWISIPKKEFTLSIKRDYRKPRLSQKPKDKNLLALFRGAVRKQSRKTHRGQVTGFPNFQHFAYSQNPRTMIYYWVGLGEKGLPTCVHVQGMVEEKE